MGNIHTVGPNEALIVSEVEGGAEYKIFYLKYPTRDDDEGEGGCCGATSKRNIVGGWAFAWWFVTDVQRISLEVMTVNPVCEHVETSQGVPLTVTGVAQIKIMRADDLLKTAAEQFLGVPVNQLRSTVNQTLEGHLRAILGTLTVEEVYRDRDQFAALVRAAPDVGSMGIEILSFTIKDVTDDVDYLSSLGKSQTANVRRDADVGVAQANRDAGIRESECQKSAMDVKYSTDTKVEDCFQIYKLQQAAFDREIKTAKAEAALAYELSAAKVSQKLKQEEKMGDVIERKKMVEIEEQEVQRKERDLVAAVKLPAEAEAFRVQTIAEGKRSETLEVARAEAERIRKIGQAETEAIVLVGKAEAEAMKAKAGAYAGFGNAGVCAMVTEALPLIAAEVAAPLARVEEITIIGGNQDNSTLVVELTKAIGSLNPAIKGLTGIDVAAALGQKYGADQKGQRSK